jgi:uncharacterized phage protein gp47/JayE
MSMFINRAELFEIGKAAVAATPGIRINPAVFDVPGSDLNIVGGLFATIGETISMRGASAMRGAFAELSRGPALDKVIYDRSGLLRFGAESATVDLVLVRPTPGSATPGTYEAGSVVQTPTGIQFGLMSDAVFGDYATSVAVSAQALIAGADGNVPATDLAAGVGVTVFSTPPFDTTLTVSNAAPAAGGADAEEDIPFLGRYLSYFPTLSKGIMGAIEYGALQVDGVRVATATEILNPESGFPAAMVQLVIGDINGNATSSVVTAVSDKLLGYRAGGMPVRVLTGLVAYEAVQWRLAYKTGYNEKLCRERVRAVTVAVSQFLPPGPERGALYRGALIAAAQQVPGVIVQDTSLLAPLGDNYPATPQTMIRVLPQSVTFA